MKRIRSARNDERFELGQICDRDIPDIDDLIEEVCKRLALLEQRPPKRLFILRAPRQTLISAYHHYRDFMQVWDGDLDDFLARSPWGAEGYVAYYNAWAQTLEREPPSLILNYASMKYDFISCLRQTVTTLGMPVIEDTLATATQAASIDNMRHLERNSGGFPGRAEKVYTNNPNALRVRVGRASAPDLSLSQHHIIDNALAQLSSNARTLLSRHGVDLAND